jgi:hypothetical protein
MAYSKRAEVLSEMLKEAQSWVVTSEALLLGAQDGSDGPIEHHEQTLAKAKARRDVLKWAYNLALLEP